MVTSINLAEIKKLLGVTTPSFRSIKVAVLDTGVCPEHLMLRGKVIEMVDVTGDNNPVDKVGHGTAVSSILAGNRMNSKYGLMEGINPSAKIINIKVFDKKGQGSFDTFIKGVYEAISLDADLIVYAGGGHNSNGWERQDVLINEIEKEYDVLTVCAAGNEHSKNGVNSPGSAFESISVGSVDLKGKHSNYSNYGILSGYSKPDVCGFGGSNDAQIISGVCGWIGNELPNGFQPLSGSSFAVPQIAGIISILISVKGRLLSREELEYVFSQSCSNVQKDVKTGWGVPNLQLCLKALKNL